MFFVFAPIAYFVVRKQGIRKGLGLRFPGAREFVVWSAALWAGLLLLSLAVSAGMDYLGWNDLDNVAAAVEGIQEKAPALLYYLLSVRVATEEVFFRGFLVKRVGLLASTGLFALAHGLYGSLSEVAGAFVLGGLLGWAYLKSGSLYPNVVAHAAYNFTVLMFFL